MCLRAAPQNEHTPMWMLLEKTSSFATCVVFNCYFLGRKKTATAAGSRDRGEMLCALWCYWGGKIHISGFLLAPLFGQEGPIRSECWFNLSGRCLW